MASNKEFRRLHFLDSLRGIAALFVVVSHFLGGLVEDGSVGRFDHWAVWLADEIGFGKYGVVLFFMISGYIIPNSLGATGDRIGRFCISRFFRLYPLYWLAVAAGVLIPWPDINQAFSTGRFLANLTMVQGYMGVRDIVGAAWTLEIELTFYGFCVLFAAFHRLSSPRSCALASVTFLAFAFVLAVLRNVMVMKLPVALPLALSLMFFGTLWRQATLFRLDEAKRIAPRLLGLIIAALIPLNVVAYNHDFGYNEHWQPYVFSYLLAIATFVLGTTRLRVSWRPLAGMGTISYSVYLLHTLVWSLSHRLGFVASALPVDPLIYVAILVSLTLLLAALTYALVEWPSVQFGHRIVRALKMNMPSQTAPQPS